MTVKLNFFEIGKVFIHKLTSDLAGRITQLVTLDWNTWYNLWTKSKYVYLTEKAL